MENKTPKEVAIEFANQKFTSIQDCIAAAKLLMNEYDLSAKGRIVNEAVRFGCYAYWELVIEELGNYRRYMESRSAEYELLPGIVYDDKNDPPPQQPSTTPTEAPTNPFQCYQHKTWGKTYCSAQCDYCKNSYAPSTEQENHHRCVKLPGGAIAIVSPNTSPELLDALDRMVELARKMPDASIEQVGEKETDEFENIKMAVAEIRLAYLPPDTQETVRSVYLQASTHRLAKYFAGKLSAASSRIALLESQLSSSKEEVGELKDALRELVQYNHKLFTPALAERMQKLLNPVNSNNNG